MFQSVATLHELKYRHQSAQGQGGGAGARGPAERWGAVVREDHEGRTSVAMGQILRGGEGWPWEVGAAVIQCGSLWWRDKGWLWEITRGIFHRWDGKREQPMPTSKMVKSLKYSAVRLKNKSCGSLMDFAICSLDKEGKRFCFPMANAFATAWVFMQVISEGRRAALQNATHACCADQKRGWGTRQLRGGCNSPGHTEGASALLPGAAAQWHDHAPATGPGPGPARRAASIASPYNTEHPAGSARKTSTDLSRGGQRGRATGGGTASRHMTGRAREAGSATALRPASLLPPDRRGERLAADSGTAPHSAALCWPGAWSSSCGSPGAVREQREARGEHSAQPRPGWATGRRDREFSHFHGEVTGTFSGTSGRERLGAEEEPGEAILTGEGWRGCTTQRVAGEEAIGPSASAFSGLRRFFAGFFLTEVLSCLLVPTSDALLRGCAAAIPQQEAEGLSARRAHRTAPLH